MDKRVSSTEQALAYLSDRQKMEAERVEAIRTELRGELQQINIKLDALMASGRNDYGEVKRR